MIVEAASFHTVITELTERFIETACCNAQSTTIWHSVLIPRWRKIRYVAIKIREGGKSSLDQQKAYLSRNSSGLARQHFIVTCGQQCCICALHSRLAIKCGKLIRLVIALATPKLQQSLFFIILKVVLCSNSKHVFN